MSSSVFVASRPLQIIVALTIIEQLGLQNDADLFIVDSFQNAQETARILDETRTGRWRNTRLFGHVNQIHEYLQHHRYDNIYLYSDVGPRRMFHFVKILLKGPFNLNVYEEGLGTYTTGHVHYNAFWRFVLPLFGIASRYGENILTKQIFLYDPEKYAKKFGTRRAKPVKIDKSFSQYITENRNFLCSTFRYEPVISNKPRNTKCYVYMSGYKPNEKVIRSLLKKDGILFVKIHPHSLKHIIVEGVHYVSAQNPAEMLLSDLSHQFDHVEVYHEKSSVTRYFSASNTYFYDITTQLFAA